MGEMGSFLLILSCRLTAKSQPTLTFDLPMQKDRLAAVLPEIRPRA